MEDIKTEKENQNNVKEYSFAKYISDLRVKRNLTQKALAEKIQVSDRTISKWENGLTVPDLHNIRAICKELGVSANSVVLEKSTLGDHIRNFFRFLFKIRKYIFNNIIKLILLIIFILLLIYFINNYNALNIYILNYDSDDIKISNGYFIRSKSLNILVIDNIELINNEDISSLQVELYTLVNSDKVVLYESNDLDDIFIEELTGYPDVLHNDVLKAITKNVYLTITTYNEFNEKNTYDCTISFKKNFSNNKITYANYIINNDYNIDYQIFLNPDINRIKHVYKNFNNSSINSLYTITQNIDIEDEDFNDDLNKLKDLGYTYDEKNNIYTKNDNGKEIIFSVNMDLLISKEVVDGIEKSLYYYIAKDRIDYEARDLNKIIIEKYKYLVSNKNIFCTLGNCKNYQKDIDYILAEYRAISAIL